MILRVKVRRKPEQGEYSYRDYDLHYCVFDGNVYLGEAALWDFYTRFGDNAIGVTIAHEMGHRIQHVAGMLMPSPDAPNEAIPRENQADCFAGANAAWSSRFGMSSNADESIAVDDVVDRITSLLNSGETEGAHQTHGTPDQRVRAFYIGYNSAPDNGAFACDFYVTDVSITPGEFNP